MKPAIVVVTYNRVGSLKRLLSSLAAADYRERDGIPLIISVDKSDTESCAGAAEDFSWEHGEKRVIRRDERLGLKRHILECGALSEEYGAVVMLEDDLMVSPCFYEYAVQALQFSEKYPNIGGISLYRHRFQVFARLPFEAIEDGFDNWYFRLPSSWGQAWSADQWKGFSDWLSVHDGEEVAGTGIPSFVSAWGESSWLKYAVRYLVETDKYFLYPRLSYTTNFADEGEHASHTVTDLQVPLSRGGDAFRFSSPEESKAVYDAYFENERLGAEADLYGIKYADTKGRKLSPKGELLLSTKSLSFKVAKTYALAMKPMDANVVWDLPGEGIFLYDLKESAPPPKIKSGRLEDYFYPGMSMKKILQLLKYRLFKA
ncbi:MAG: glycosyltransferase family 2 protein [Lachnospiraceae bacterium]|nr:glycosyltransferase family 2 protein [Lachnospiraceae bacterium]